MNTDSVATEELVCFICDELQRYEDDSTADNARILRSFCIQAESLSMAGRSPILVLWMDTHWSYSVITGKRSMEAIAEVAGEYFEHLLGNPEEPCVFVARINRRRSRKAC